MMNRISRRNLIIGSAAVGATIAAGNAHLSSASAQEGLDLSKPLNGWDTVAGRWTTEEVPGAAQGGWALVQRATANEFNVIVAPGGSYDDVIVSVRFKPISGAEDASAGIVFRFAEGRYYVMLTTAAVKPPALSQWHTLQISAKRNRLQGWLNDQRLIDHNDSRFVAGRIGLWTKADSVTAFDSLSVLPIEGG